MKPETAAAFSLIEQLIDQVPLTGMQRRQVNAALDQLKKDVVPVSEPPPSPVMEAKK